MSQKPASRRIEVTLVAGGKYHDIDFARRELLTLLAEHDEFRVRVQPDYEDVDGITAAEILVSYTCDVRPSENAQRAVRAWVENGGRWVALHGTNAALTLGGPNGVESPRIFPCGPRPSVVSSSPTRRSSRTRCRCRTRRTGWCRVSNRSTPTTSCTSASTPTAPR